MRESCNGSGRFAKDGHRNRYAFRKRSGRPYVVPIPAGIRDVAIARTRIARYGYKLYNLRRVAQQTGRPTKEDALLKRELYRIVYTECQRERGRDRLSASVVSRVLDITTRAVENYYQRGQKGVEMTTAQYESLVQLGRQQDEKLDLIVARLGIDRWIEEGIERLAESAQHE